MSDIKPLLDRSTQIERARQFAQFHQNPPLVLPNAWDAASARLIEMAGAKAIATSSGGCAWSLGFADGDEMNRELAAGVIRRIADVVSVPVTADIERGYGESIGELKETIAAVLAAGAVGVNLEDSGGDPLYPAEVQAERIAAAREVADTFGVPLFINARTDVYMARVGPESGRLDEVVKRARIYAEAGASGLFVPALLDLATLRTLTSSVSLPVNALVGPGAPLISDLVQAGVSRISVGTRPALTAYAAAQHAARELLTQGSYPAMSDPLDYMTINREFVGHKP